MAERRDIPDALRDAVERTVRATVDTRERAQDAVGDVAGSANELVRGAEKGIRTGQRSVRAAVEDKLPATQEDIKLLTAELREVSRRLDVIETRLAAGGPAAPTTPRRGGGSAAV